MYAICLEKLGLEPGMSFLDIGSGCGLLTAVRRGMEDAKEEEKMRN